MRRYLGLCTLGLSTLALASCAALHAAYQASQYAQSHPGHKLKSYYLPASSMMPTYRPNTILLADLSAYESSAPQRNDIVLFTPPVLPAPSSPFIKRVVGLPGDRMQIKRDGVYLNDRKVKEPFVREPAAYTVQVKNFHIYVDEGAGPEPLQTSAAAIPPRSEWRAPDRLPRNCYFVLGDNRNNSEDSHIYGCIGRAAIAGKVVDVLSTPPKP